MIRVAIVAATAERARRLAEFFAEDDLLEIVETNTGDVDVLVVLGSIWEQMPRQRPLSVIVTDRPAEEGQLGTQIRAWLPLNASEEEIRAAIVAAANDLVVLTSAQARRWLHTEAENDSIFVEALTERELQVLRMMADGLGNKEIARHLGISDHTAKFHVAQILAKLGVNSRTEAVAVGIRRGLVPI